MSYRLPKRFGIIKLEAKNIFDEQFQFVDTDPAHPQVPSGTTDRRQSDDCFLAQITRQYNIPGYLSH